MSTQQGSQTRPSSNKVLWVVVSITAIIVLIMGATLLRLKSQPPEPLPAVLPTTQAPPVIASAAAPDAVVSATPMAAASTANDLVVDTSRPRRVQPHASEPAVARTP